MDEKKTFTIEKIFSVDCFVDSDGYATLDAQVELDDGRIVIIAEVSEIAVGMRVRVSRIKVFCHSGESEKWELADD